MSSGWPGTHGLQASTSWFLSLQTCITMLSLFKNYFFFLVKLVNRLRQNSLKKSQMQSMRFHLWAGHFQDVRQVKVARAMAAVEQRPDLVAALVSLELGVESSKLSLLQAVADSSPLEISLSLKGCSGRPCDKQQASQETGPVDIKCFICFHHLLFVTFQTPENQGHPFCCSEKLFCLNIWSHIWTRAKWSTACQVSIQARGS